MKIDYEYMDDVITEVYNIISKKEKVVESMYEELDILYKEEYINDMEYDYIEEYFERYIFYCPED